MSEKIDYLAIINDKPKPKIRKEAFEEKYLPLLFDPDPAVFNLQWISDVAISPFLEVEVITKDNKIAYIVPPLRKPYQTTLDTELSNIANLAQMESRIHVLKGQIYLNQHLPTAMHFTRGRSPDLEKRWRELIIKTGYGDKLSTVSIDEDTKMHGIGLVEMIDDEDW